MTNVHDFTCCKNLCGHRQLSVYYLPDWGVLVRTAAGWFSSNDVRHQLVGVFAKRRTGAANAGAVSEQGKCLCSKQRG